jgi:hypothetical protein
MSNAEIPYIPLIRPAFKMLLTAIKIRLKWAAKSIELAIKNRIFKASTAYLVGLLAFTSVLSLLLTGLVCFMLWTAHP